MERGGRKGYITERNGRSFWERQGIVAFCACQWNEWFTITHSELTWVSSYSSLIEQITQLTDSSLKLSIFWFLAHPCQDTRCSSDSTSGHGVVRSHHTCSRCSSHSNSSQIQLSVICLVTCDDTACDRLHLRDT